jgi:hypothetical protein
MLGFRIGNRVLIVALVAVLSVGMVVAEAGASAGTPTAIAAKKKCKKHKKKCKKASAIAKATAFLAGKKLSRVSYSQSTGASSTEAFSFCRNGTLLYRGDFVGYGGTSWADTFDGTWRVTAATATSATVFLTANNFHSVYFDGSPGPDSPPPSSGSVGMVLTGPTTVTSNGVEYSVSAGSC